jgi:CheY-like chemotaxis protein
VLSVPARAPEASDATSSRVPMERLARLPPAAEPQPLLGRRVLIVDDDEDTRELLAVVLGDAGARTATAAAAAPALAAFVAQPFDVVVSDLGMPGEDGLSLIRKLRAHEASLGVGVGVGGASALAVALSGYAAVEDTLAAGFQAHLTKPCEPSQLIALIAKLRPASG